MPLRDQKSVRTENFSRIEDKSKVESFDQRASQSMKESQLESQLDRDLLSVETCSTRLSVVLERGKWRKVDPAKEQ